MILSATKMFLLIFLVNILAINRCEPGAVGCEISLNRANAPLVFYPRSTQLMYPSSGEDSIRLKTGDVVRFACPGTQVLVKEHTTQQTVVDSTCTSNKRFSIQGNEYSWDEASCDGSTTSVARVTHKSCENNGKQAEIGFDLGDNGFAQIILICFDSRKQTTLYSTYNLTASIDNRPTRIPRPSFYQDDGFYNIGNAKVDNLYKRSRQRKNINRQLGLSRTDKKYINVGQLYFLSRGHLTARTDFVYPAQLNATFRFINVAPQWESFNGRNWNRAEINTRAYASRNRVDLQVWTGTYGIATLPHETSGKDVDLYLYDNAGIKAIPVPALYWKLIYNPISKTGVVLIGINNPYEENITKHIICPDVSSKVGSWFENINSKNHLDGYMYACTVPDFRKNVTYAPKLKISGLLV